MSLTGWLALLFAAAAVITYRYHEPLPACMNDVPFRWRIGLHLKPSIDSMAGFAEFVGLAKKSQFQRGALSLFQRREADSDSLSSLDTEFDGVRVRVYVPAKHAARGASLFFVHGGAWVLNDINTYDSTVRGIAAGLGLVTISVDYRLAPEFPYPAALTDVERAFRYFVKHAADFDIDPARIAVIGDSAGANLATVLAVRLRDEADSKKSADTPRIKLQILINPNSQTFEFSSVSRLVHQRDYVHPQYAMVAYRLQFVLGMDFYNSTLRHLAKRYLFGRCYRGEVRKRVEAAYKNSKNEDIRERIMTPQDRAVLQALREDKIAREKFTDPKCSIPDEATLVEVEQKVWPLFDPSASPLLTPKLDRLPPVYIISVGVDGLRDDALLYIERLRDAGVVIHHRDYPEECHGFTNFGKVDKMLAGLREVLAKNPSLL